MDIRGYRGTQSLYNVLDNPTKTPTRIKGDISFRDIRLLEKYLHLLNISTDLYSTYRGTYRRSSEIPDLSEIFSKLDQAFESIISKYMEDMNIRYLYNRLYKLAESSNVVFQLPEELLKTQSEALQVSKAMEKMATNIMTLFMNMKKICEEFTKKSWKVRDVVKDAKVFNLYLEPFPNLKCVGIDGNNPELID